MLRNIRAQSTAEYVIVLGLIVAAVIGMQTYVKRGFQGRIKDAVNYVDYGGASGDSVTFTTKQYEPYYLESDFSSKRNSSEDEDLLTGGAVTRSSTDASRRGGSQTILVPKEE
ncbi:MAG: hypothetical protein PHT50_02525 [Candidatus Omnitrophica bacterium]|nr:hypothetical protein [Candidatus Omnitrophota bacterium]